MKSIICLVVLVVLKLEYTQSANILAVFPLPGKSHFNLLETLIKPLLARGHDVDVVSHFPLKNQLPGYNDLSVRGSVPILNNNLTMERSYVMNFQGIATGMKLFGNRLSEPILKSTTIAELKNSTKRYDVLLHHIFLTDTFLGLSHIFDIPTIGIITSVNLPWTSKPIGLPDNPSYIPNYFSPYGQEMNFFQRFMNTALYVFTKYLYSSTVHESDMLLKKYFGDATPGSQELMNKMSLILSNSHYSLNQPRALVPNFIEVGGIHIKEGKPLSKHISDSMHSEHHGVIYLSFGSMIKTESFRPEILQAMFDVFSELPYKIMWKADRNQFPEHLRIPSNIQFETWMPQLEILCHPRTKLFISHGGLLGTQEAVYCGVPVLGIPFVADQSLNIESMSERKIALSVKYESITKTNFKETITTLLHKNYKENAEKLSKLFKDRPMSPLDTAIYWIEYVIRHNGAPHLKSMSAKLPWYKYYLVDVIAAYLVIVLVAMLVSYKMIENVYSVLNMIVTCDYVNIIPTYGSLNFCVLNGWEEQEKDKKS